jgi:steroid delta-isomerase-like uncharacterized protein
MTRADVAALFKRRDEAWNRRDAAALAADHAEDAVGESPLQGRLVGRARIHDVYKDWCSAFPDLVWRTDDLLVEGNRAVQFFTITATHTNPFGGVPATGRRMQITGAFFATLDDDCMITHDRRVYDVTNMLVQLGALRTKPATQ